MTNDKIRHYCGKTSAQIRAFFAGDSFFLVNAGIFYFVIAINHADTGKLFPDQWVIYH